MSEPEENKGFKVTDRRSFTPEGELRSEAEEADAPGASEPREREAVEAEKTESVPRTEGAGRPEVRFLDLLSLLATQASLHLGEPNPVTGEEKSDLPSAQVMISMMEILQEKTKGNLSDDEGKALEEILYQLRMRFMIKAKIVK